MTQGIISNLFTQHEGDTVSRRSIDLIKRVYLNDSRPWVVGFSGGKDSTLTTQLIFEALLELSPEQLHKKVFIISSDTLVENPLVVSMINGSLHRMQEAARKYNLPIETQKVKPLTEQTFWTNIIGRGYPTPNLTFRWCTDRLKIDPANRFIKDKVSKYGEIIMVLGVRSSESTSRGQSIKNHEISGSELMRHTSLTNAYVFAPIKEFVLDDVWSYLLQNPAPWGEDHHKLQKMYMDSSSECPLVVDQNIKESAGSCGNSRFGCWTCTVVNQDKSLTGFIQTGEHDWLKPLLKFRNKMVLIRDDRSKRMRKRMNGSYYLLEIPHEVKEDGTYINQKKKGGRAAFSLKAEENYDELNDSKIYAIPKEKLNSLISKHNIDLSKPETSDLDFVVFEVNDSGHRVYSQLGPGPFTFSARVELMKDLLVLQRDLRVPNSNEYKLIHNDELREIRRIWIDEGDWEDTLPKLYREVFGFDLEWEKNDRRILTSDQANDLELLSQKYGLDFNMVQKLFTTANDFVGVKVKRGFNKDVANLLSQDYLNLYKEQGDLERDED
ncbi:putative sulfurtransferase DndC [Exiguobacterium sp. S17]|nr:putative sulfurtransferase DndC [Exiguobacterium sp. S17]